VAGFAAAACASRGADPGPAGPWDTLAIKGGRVLHNATVLSDEGDSVVIRCDEGLVKVAKSSLPQAAADAYPAKAPAPMEPQMVMQPFNPDVLPVAPEPEARPKPGPPKVTPAPKAAPSLVFKGCTIASFTMKPFQNSLGCAEVVVQNGSESPVVILPGDLACVAPAGKRLGGRQIVVDGFPPVIKRRQIVPPMGSADFMVTFSSDSLDGSTVQWAR
jgi:hypothetical protein